ncbi:hypothetical protein ACFOTA_06725 [Chitinophaga sp. GCM10012297]|uniref:Uncharacterized protein n=1 Tax=Chitinophaga chungangae TaxID=2821488 RepID=A0ABS3YB50_9BACT|nr:hypothetical protein [Chitinophaga chungangae]MBO9151894.1 hypothetical protein [Chitinophaga chungangae]
MTRKQLQDYLEQFPEEMPIMVLIDNHSVDELTEEQILHTSDTAYVDVTAPEEEWDCEDGKIRLGDGSQYVLINAIII